MLCDVPVGHPCVPKPPLCHGDGVDHQRRCRDATRPGKAFPVLLQDLLHGWTLGRLRPSVLVVASLRAANETTGLIGFRGGRGN